MALARVVAFEGVSSDRIAEMKREAGEGERPEVLPASEFIMLHGAESERIARDRLLRDRRRLPARRRALNAMPAGETPGQRTSVTKYDVAIRMAA